MITRVFATMVLLVALVASCDFGNKQTPGPTFRPDGSSPTPTTGGGGPFVPGPVQAGSVGEASLRHPLIATGIDPTTGGLIGEGTQFPTGTTDLVIAIGWAVAQPGATIGVRIWPQGHETFTHEFDHVVVNQGTNKTGAGFVAIVSNPDGLPDGAYLMQTSYNSKPEEIVTFSVGDVPPPSVLIGEGEDSGPIPYKPAGDVLVITRSSVLRANLGDRTDEVLTAAARVGELHDLDESAGAGASPEAAAEYVHNLLATGGQHYLLILGNDDAVPFFHVANPLESLETKELEGSQLPVDWLPSDDPYGDTVSDARQTPDVAVARIPSSDDADLLLKQLGENTPSDGHGYALINQKRRTPGATVIKSMSTGFGVQAAYSPPVTPDTFATSYGPAARYLYILSHGIGVETDGWYADVDSWVQNESDGEWTVTALPGVQQVPSVTVAGNPGSTGVVSVGACYGAWTLDTVLEPRHKTAKNNLALFYLKSGVRAFVADTHLSYSSSASQEILDGRTGFEKAMWDHIGAGDSPIDAFQKAKVEMSQAVDQAIAAKDPSGALLNLKTLHYMIYLGRP